jgi:ubiquinone/menaquinone biosynthesis C-methylase UbiE
MLMDDTRGESYYGNMREDLIKLMPPNPRHILDVGCGIGAMGRKIKSVMGNDVEVVGVERDPSAGKRASEALDRVFIGDIESIDLPLGAGYFDCIIYGDVLEHLLDPWSLLKKHRLLLKAGGCVIASIPNIAHYRIIKMLRRNEWNYSAAGILDKGHIRFFTIKSIREMFEDAGLEIVRIEHNIAGSRTKKVINLLLNNILLDRLTEQYIIVARHS